MLAPLCIRRRSNSWLRRILSFGALTIPGCGVAIATLACIVIATRATQCPPTQYHKPLIRLFLDCNMNTPVFPQAREVYPAHTADFPLEGQFPKTMEQTSSLLSLPDRSNSLPPTTEESSRSNGQGPGTSAASLANDSAAADLDMMDIWDDLLGGSVPSSDPDASFEVLPEGMAVLFDFAFAFG
ncbi:hypothetical protein EDD85DRAFT_334047 [Armillaria nabsnona]|nr:hypothetical protein EDD85DRAFT_334047 [Armillaria nabsnona]